jgi:membrane protein YdbS with pleckstrin-like domain
VFCNKCGVELPDGSAFCNKCGTPQGGAAPAAPAPAAAGAIQPSQQAVHEPTKEEDVWRGRYSFRAQGMGFVGAGLWLVGLWIAYLVMSAKGQWFEDKAWFLWLIVALSPLPLLYVFGVATSRWLTIRYRLTTQRFFIERGFIGRKIDEVELIRVDDVSVNQNVIQRIFDVGTVMIISTDATHPRLGVIGVRSPVALKEKVRSLMKESRKRSVHFEAL